MSSDPVLVHREDGVATVTLNRPEKMNSLDTKLMSILPGCLEELAHDREVRCVVLTGAGDRAFSAGGDITEMVNDGPAGARSSSGEPMETAVAGLRDAMEASSWLHEMPKPTLAAVNGACAGASLSLALACDLRIAAEHAVFVTAFVRIGYSGDFGGSYYLTKIVGTAKARELYFLSERVGAEEALRIGIVNRVVPGKDLRREVNALARQIADGPPIAYRYMKRNLNLAVSGQHRELLDREAEAMIRTGMTEDFGNAARAFLEKKTPTFRGR